MSDCVQFFCWTHHTIEIDEVENLRNDRLQAGHR